MLVHGLGNLGDQLILEGTRALLSDRHFREIALEELGRSEGDLALIVGGGAFSAAYHEWARWALQLAETRFGRVIVLPSTFDVSVREVRAVLETTTALVFARERKSFAAIRDLCDARLAFDAAFQYDFAPHRRMTARESSMPSARTARRLRPGRGPATMPISRSLPAV